VKELYASDISNEITTPDDAAYFRSTVGRVFSALPRDRRTEYDKVTALTDYVSRQAVYTLSVAPLPAGSDHVRAFLQDTRAGYCDMFASSLAVLCRVAGYPSRVATGFGPGTFDGTHYVLRVLDKHAWTEVYFPGYGWVPFDATIGSATATSASTDQRKSISLWQRIREFVVERGPVAPVLIGAILLILAYIVKVELIDGLRTRRRRAATQVSRVEIGKQYERMVKAMGHLGMRRKLSETPLEFSARAVPYLQRLESTLGGPVGAQAVAGFSKRYAEVRYGSKGMRDLYDGRPDPELAAFLCLARRARIKLILSRARRRKLMAAGPEKPAA
jgi:hypothetical protein